ncbi:hypothetical protein MTR_7g085265 [Medicago truncatula]|uniref:Uncharacterized protein n=1 Tax=Medicago truncatula TaxID=3880 RepID=A0A072UCE1_MEDTR|nr:hypothetical protein MTR_7g085265 [Medicago truncatula]
MTRFLRTKDSRGNEEKPVIVVTETRGWTQLDSHNVVNQNFESQFKQASKMITSTRLENRITPKKHIVYRGVLEILKGSHSRAMLGGTS